MKDHQSLFVRPICPVGAMKSLLILAVAASFFATTDSAHAVPIPQTATYATLGVPITSPFCRPDCFGTTFSRMAESGPGFGSLAVASASFGSVGAEVSVHIDGGVSSGRPSFAESDGFFVDNITITGPAGTGTVSFAVDLHGTAFTTIPGIVDPRLDFVFGANGPAGGARIDVHSLIDGYPSRTFTTPSFAYTFGDTITIFMELTASLGQRAEGDGSTPLIANLLYHDTATLKGLTVLDARGVPVTSFSISSESGTSYPLSSAPALSVPEPNSAWLLVAGGLMLLRRRRAQGK